MLLIKEHTSIETEKLKQTYNAVVVLGKNLGVGYNAETIAHTPYYLSPHSMLNVFAAALIYQPDTTMIFSTGKTAGDKVPSEAEAMANFFRITCRDMGKDFIEEDIKLEKVSYDTRTNLINSATVLSTLNLPEDARVAVLSTDFHAPTINILQKQQKLHMETLKALDVLYAGNSEDQQLAVEYLRYYAHLFYLEEAKEFVRGALLRFDMISHLKWGEHMIDRMTQRRQLH